jgi:glucose-specific phosphotransferase system IIA component
MGLFDFLKKKKTAEVSSTQSNTEYETGVIYAPLNGSFVKQSDIPDPVFAEGMMGPAVAINPESGNGVIYSPINGEIVTLFPTKHAIGLKSEEGIEVLIHFGLDTVNLQGEGFESHITSGEKVVVGQKLVTVDMTAIKDKVPSLVTPIVITSQQPIEILASEGPIEVGAPLLKIVK